MKKWCPTDNNRDLIIGQALSALVYARTWPLTQRVLEEFQAILLQDRTLELLDYMINQSYLAGNIDDAANLGQYKWLLLNSRVFGIASAWRMFINQ